MEFETGDEHFGSIEIRQDGKGKLKEFFAHFPYGGTAVIADRGKVRKERFQPYAFRHAIEIAKPFQEMIDKGLQAVADDAADAASRKAFLKELEANLATRDRLRQIDLLVGHSFNRPLASTRNGSLKLKETAQGVTLRAALPPAEERPSWMIDAIASVRSGLMRGLSPGFRIPPRSAVPSAVSIVQEAAEEGGAFIRNIHEALLYEFSLVTRPSYAGAALGVRQEDLAAAGEEVETDERARVWLYR